MGTIVYTDEVGFESFGDMLWSGARERWNDADEQTRELVWNRVEEWANHIMECGDVPSSTRINDLVWFDCDDLFYPPKFELKIWRHDYVELIEETEFDGRNAEDKAMEHYENWKSEHEDYEHIAKLVNTETGEEWEL